MVSMQEPRFRGWSSPEGLRGREFMLELLGAMLEVQNPGTGPPHITHYSDQGRRSTAALNAGAVTSV
jgi:hypothetical protein